MNTCTTPEEIEELLLDKNYIVNDDVFNQLPIGTLKILKLFILKGYVINENSYKVIMSNVFSDDEYYATIEYLYKNKYDLPKNIINDVMKMVELESM